MKLKTIFFLAGVLLSSHAMALEGMSLGVGSHHFGDETPCDGKPEYNESNPGLGFRIRRQPEVEYEIGVYKNSLSDRSYYGSAIWLPLQYKYLELGVMGGVANGYCKKVTPIGGLVMNLWLVKGVGVQVIGVPPIKDRITGIAALRVLINF